MRLTAVLLAAALLAVTLGRWSRGAWRETKGGRKADDMQSRARPSVGFRVPAVHGLPAAQRDVIVGAETIELAEATTANGEMFTTKLHRVEELVKSDNQYYYADNQNSVNNGVRDVSVVVVLNVQDDGTLLINGMPAPMGRSTQKIDAVVVQTGADDLNRNVQVTLDVAVRVVEQQTPIGFGKVYTIEEHITELDGDRVFETSMRQWTVEVTEDGKDVKYGMAVARFNDMLPVRVPIEGIVRDVGCARAPFHWPQHARPPQRCRPLVLTSVCQRSRTLADRGAPGDRRTRPAWTSRKASTTAANTTAASTTAAGATTRSTMTTTTRTRTTTTWWSRPSAKVAPQGDWPHSVRTPN